LNQSVQDREEYKDIQKLYNSLCKSLREFEQEKIEFWEKSVESNTSNQLNKFLLVREENDIAPEGHVRVNFDPILTALLREVKYLQLLDIKVPDTAKTLFEKVDVYRS
jgi:dynein heavy chain